MRLASERITWPTVCIFGDSIVEGAHDETGQGWADRLKAEWKVALPDGEFRPNVYNLGIDGDRTTEILERLESEALARNAQGIILSVGVNDLPWADGRVPTDPDVFVDQYREVLTVAADVTINVLVVGLLRVVESAGDHGIKNSDIKALNITIKRLAKGAKIEFLDVYDLLSEEDLADGVHPNASGYQKIYEAVKTELERLEWDKL